MLTYIGKYISKPEKALTSYTELQSQILPYVNDRAPLLSFVSKLLNKLIAERNWSAQEVSYILLKLLVQGCSYQTVTLNCWPEGDQQDLIVVESGEVSSERSALQRYRDRIADTEGRNAAVIDLSLFNWLQSWN